MEWLKQNKRRKAVLGGVVSFFTLSPHPLGRMCVQCTCKRCHPLQQGTSRLQGTKELAMMLPAYIPLQVFTMDHGKLCRRRSEGWRNNIPSCLKKLLREYTMRMRACVLCSMIVAKKRLLLCCELYTSVTVASAPTQSKVRTDHRNEACVHNTFLQPHPNNVDDWFVKDFNILSHVCNQTA